jgi:hypothetical protein
VVPHLTAGSAEALRTALLRARYTIEEDIQKILEGILRQRAEAEARGAGQEPPTSTTETDEPGPDEPQPM